MTYPTPIPPPGDKPFKSLDCRDYFREPAVLIDPWWILRVVRMRAIVRSAWRPGRPLGNRLTARRLGATLKARPKP